MLATALFPLLLLQEPPPSSTALTPAPTTALTAAPNIAERKADAPRLDVFPKGRLDLGSLGPHEKRGQRYTFTNTSAAPIRLRVLDLSPGVTATGPALVGPIPPKGSAELILQVDPTDWVGWQPRNVRLGTDDPRQGEYYLPIGMTVRPDLSVDGLNKSFGAVAPHESPQVTFRFTRETGAATRLSITSALPPYLQAEAEDIPGSTEGKPLEGALRFTLRPQLVAPGMQAGLETITVETNAPLQPKFQLYLDWKLDLPVTLEPARLVFLAAEVATQTLTLEGKNGRTLSVEKAWIEGPGFSLEGPIPPAATKMVLRVRRDAVVSSKAVLFLRLKNEGSPLRIPLLYLPPVH